MQGELLWALLILLSPGAAAWQATVFCITCCLFFTALQTHLLPCKLLSHCLRALAWRWLLAMPCMRLGAFHGAAWWGRIMPYQLDILLVSMSNAHTMHVRRASRQTDTLLSSLCVNCALPEGDSQFFLCPKNLMAEYRWVVRIST